MPHQYKNYYKNVERFKKESKEFIFFFYYFCWGKNRTKSETALIETALTGESLYFKSWYLLQILRLSSAVAHVFCATSLKMPAHMHITHMI